MWNQDGGINSNRTETHKSILRTYYIKSFHNMLPTLKYLKQRKLLLYTNDICIQCNESQETQSHLWECPSVTKLINNIHTKSENKLIKIIKQQNSNLETEINSQEIQLFLHNFYKKQTYKPMQI